MTITEAAKKATLTRTCLSLIINGHGNMSVITAKKLEPVLGKEWHVIIQMPPETLKKTIKEA